MSEPTFYIENLSSQDLELLTQLFSLTPTHLISPSWLHDQTHLISTFPSSLLKPRSLLLRLATALPFSPGKAQLCNTHKQLNSILIRRIFLEVSAECTTHLERLVKNDYLPSRVAECVKRLQAVNSLWMSPELYRAVFLPIPEDKRFERIESRCEACILASVGGSHHILSDLRASMMGRKKRDRQYPVLLEMVEAWIDWTGRGNEIRTESIALAKEIRHCRRQIQKARRQMRRCAEDGSLELDYDHGHETETETLVEEGSDEPLQDPGERGEREKSIIDYYAKHMSTTRTISRTDAVNGLHEAFRESIVVDPIFQPVVPKVHSSQVRNAYTESSYSTNSQGGQKQTDYAPSSEKYALSYQNLLGIPKERSNPAAERRAE